MNVNPCPTGGRSRCALGSADGAFSVVAVATGRLTRVGHVLVLGEGWVGSAVAARACADHEVTTLDPPFVAELAPKDGAASAELTRIVTEGGVTSVVNACGLTRGTSEALTDANVDFPRWLCDALAGTGVRLVHLGSASEYGDPGSADPVAETAAPAPGGDYATTKAAGSDVVIEARRAGLDAVVARVFNIVGLPVPPVSPIHQWLTDLDDLPPGGGEVEVWWPPTTRDFVTLDDVAAAIVELAGRGDRPEVVNVCSGVGLTYGEIVAALAAAQGIDATVRSLDRPGIEAVVGDPSLLERTIGWIPTMSLERITTTLATTSPHVSPRAGTA